MSQRLFSKSLILLACLTLPQPAFSSAYKEIKDVEVSCDTALNCTLSLTPKIYDGVTGFSLYRGYQLDNSLSVRIESELTINPGDRFLVTIDGKDSRSFVANRSGIKESGMHYVETDPDIVAWIIQGMKAGARADVKHSQSGKSASNRFSLSGSVAGMIFMDEYQDLLDTPLALHIKGNYEPNDRIPITKVSSREQFPEQIWDNWFASEDSMCHFYGSTAALELGGGFKLTLSGGELYGLPCGTGGAYNQPYAFFTVPADQTKPIEMTRFILDGNMAFEENNMDLWNIGFDAKTNVISSFFRGRGLGDCGVQSKWGLLEEGNWFWFEAQEIREKPDCDGNYAGGPDNWPITWPVAD